MRRLAGLVGGLLLVALSACTGTTSAEGGASVMANRSCHSLRGWSTSSNRSTASRTRAARWSMRRALSSRHFLSNCMPGPNLRAFARPDCAHSVLTQAWSIKAARCSEYAA